MNRGIIFFEIVCRILVRPTQKRTSADAQSLLFGLPSPKIAPARKQGKATGGGRGECRVVLIEAWLKCTVRNGRRRGFFLGMMGEKKVAEFKIFTGKLGPRCKFSRGKGSSVLFVRTADLWHLFLLGSGSNRIAKNWSGIFIFSTFVLRIYRKGK